MIFYVSLFYVVVGALFLLYFGCLYRSYRRGVVFTFFNLSAAYYFVFFYLPYGLIVTGVNYEYADFRYDFFFISFYYSCLLVIVAIAHNLRLPRAAGCWLKRGGSGFAAPAVSDVNDRHVLFFVALKVGVLAFGFTPLQFGLLAGDLSAAHALQAARHTTSGYDVVGVFYSFVGPVAAIVFISRAFIAKSYLYRVVLICLAVETLGWYFSKSGIAVALLAFLVVYWLSKRTSLLGLFLLSVLIVYVAFSYRIGAFLDYSYVWDVFTRRVVSETGYSVIHLKLIQEAGPPLSFADRYYLGFRTLFGIEPAGDWSREAYYLEKGRYGATTSGYAAVNLFAFWGWLSLIVAPIILMFVSRVDLYLVKVVGSSVFLRAAYVLLSLLFVNALTVNVTRVVDYRFVFNPRLAIVAFIVFVMYTCFLRGRGPRKQWLPGPASSGAR